MFFSLLILVESNGNFLIPGFAVGFLKWILGIILSIKGKVVLLFNATHIFYPV